MLQTNSVVHFIGSVMLLASALISSQGFCCSGDHQVDPMDYPGGSAEVCVCLCHSITVFDEDACQIPVSDLDKCKHPLIDEKPYDQAFVHGIDHPPKS